MQSMPARCRSSARNSPAGPAPTIPTWVRMELLLRLEERPQRVGLLVLAFDIGSHAPVEIGKRQIHLLGLRVLADEVGDLLHLADEAIGLVKHLRDRTGEVLHEVRMAPFELRTQL